MGLWDDAERAKSTETRAQQDEQAAKDTALAKLFAEQQALLRELIDGFKARGIAPERHELKYQSYSKIVSYFPKRRVVGWKADDSGNRVITADGDIVDTVAKSKGHKHRAEDLPRRDSDSDGKKLWSGNYFKSWLQEVAKLHL